MKTKKSFLVWLSLIAASSMMVSATAALVLLTINYEFFSNSNENLRVFSSIAILVMLMSVLLLQFATSAGVLNHLDAHSASLGFWTKVFLYLMIFPLLNLAGIMAVGDVFNFLPNPIDAAAQGANALIVQAMMKELLLQLFVIAGITYAFVIGAGLLFRVIRQKNKKVPQ